MAQAAAAALGAVALGAVGPAVAGPAADVRSAARTPCLAFALRFFPARAPRILP